MCLSRSNKTPHPVINVRRVLSDRRGFSILEVVIAIFLTTVGVLAIMSLQPAAWQTAFRSDYMGRAAGILHEELQTRESFIMNCCNTVTAGTTEATVYAGGGTSAQAAGDARFTVTTTIASIDTNVWRVTVRVAWHGHTGISEGLVVTRQQAFSYPAGCSCT